MLVSRKDLNASHRDDSKRNRMKRVGYIYEQMAQWENIVEAENVSTKRKMRNPGVMRHVENRFQNLCEIQQMILDNRMQTGEYIHEQRVSGQDKLRDIAKLHFHPSHIEHQLLVMAADRRIDRSFIRHTYASRKGYGQIACALSIKKCLRKYRGTERWYGQGDICKYYDNIQHSHIESELRKLFKDEKFIRAFVEPFEKFAPEGKGIPLGIRPSQSTGNFVFNGFDHFMTEENKCEDYRRYLDDFFFTGSTNGEVKRKMKRAEKYLAKRGFKMHVPKIYRVHEGIDMMGFVFYGSRNDMYWRKSDKVRWLRRRARVTNKKRLEELDNAAWGMLKWGNTHCKRLWCMKTGRKINKKRYKKKDMVKLKSCAIKRTERTDSNGNPFIDAPKIGMQILLNKPVEIERWITGIKTSQGPGRYALKLDFMGASYKLIINAVEIKSFLDDMKKNGVTRVKTVFIDRGGMHYGIDYDKTEILEVHGRRVKLGDDGATVVYEDNGEPVVFGEKTDEINNK